MPSVSVIVPSYNRAHLIGQTLESVLAQTYQDFEVIVVDDGSTDETYPAVRPFRFRLRGRLVYVFQENRGLSAARNTGCRLASGRYLAFLDSDDLWKPEKLSRQVPVLEADPTVGLVASMAEVVDATNTTVLGIKPKTLPGATLRELVFRGSAAPSTFVVRREAIAGVGYFDPEIKKGIEDLDLCFRLARQWKLVCLEQPLIRYRQHSTNISSEPVGTYAGFIRTYEKLLAVPDKDVPRKVVRQSLAKYYYLLGTVYARRREARPALAQVLRAIKTSPLVGLTFITGRQLWWQRCTAALKPYAVACALGAGTLFHRNGQVDGV